VRCCEFIMKDAYSFGSGRGWLEANNQRMLQAYKRIFARSGCNAWSTKRIPRHGRTVFARFHRSLRRARRNRSLCPAASALFPQKEGARRVFVCKGQLEKKNPRKSAIFQTGTKYSSMLNANSYAKGNRPPLSWVVTIWSIAPYSTIIEQNHDA
jgi:prolyl-tRNA synthetase